MNVKEEFVNWFFKNANGRYSSLNEYTVTQDLEESNRRLDRDIFNVDESNFKELQKFLRIELYKKNTDFDIYSRGVSNHRPRAFLGKENYLKFLNEKFSSRIEKEKNTTIDKSPKVTKKTLSFPLNTILYGPPGTGKTFKLQDVYFKKFTVQEDTLTMEQYLETMVTDLTWWQTFALALKDLGAVSTTKMLEHPIVKAKERLSSAKNIKPIAWSRLQAHTVEECPNVKVTVRSEPRIFYKEENSDWRVDLAALEALYPEADQLLGKVKKFQPSAFKTIKNYEFVTFHQSFSYEDFVEGIKPKMDSDSSDLTYEISDGIFKKMAIKAKANPDQEYAIFIDEINRGNVSAIFGELITLLEEDKRLGEENELTVKLPYSKDEFEVPSNLYLFGTMNTADRSVEALDTALRRRFVFEEIMPEPELLRDIQFDGFDLEEVLQTINPRIEALLDRDHAIGHSYFIKIESGDTEALRLAFENRVLPLLQEYFYHDYEKIALILGEGFVERSEGGVEFAFKGLDAPETTVSYNLRNDLLDIEKAVRQLLNRSDEAKE